MSSENSRRDEKVSLIDDLIKMGESEGLRFVDLYLIVNAILDGKIISKEDLKIAFDSFRKNYKDYNEMKGDENG